MTEIVDIKIIQNTQNTLGKLIKKPPMSEKLLGKPPFRFLHDVLTAVINTTGFMKGLYTLEEMVSENVKDKEKKITFLQKAIDVVGLIMRQKVNVRPSKVVAGLEVEKTNEFLQLLAAAIEKQVDTEEAVKKVLNKHSAAGANGEEAKKSPEKKMKEKKTVTITTGAQEIKASNDNNNKEKIMKKELKENLEKVKVKKTDDKTKTKTDLELKKHKSSRQSKEVEKVSNKNDLSNKVKSKNLTNSTNKTAEASKVRKSSKAQNELEVKQSSSPKKSLTNESLLSKPNEEDGSVRNSAKSSSGGSSSGTRARPSTATRERAHRSSISSSSANANKEIKEEVMESEIVSLGTNEKEKVEGSPTKLQSNRVSSAEQQSTANTDQGYETGGNHNSLEMNESNNEAAHLEEAPPPPPQRPHSTVSRRPPSARPVSARPAALRVQVVDIAEEQTKLDSTSTVPNIILDDSKGQEQDENDTFVVEEDAAQVEKPFDDAKSTLADDVVPSGSLVSQILETKKDLEVGNQWQTSHRVEIEKSEISENAKLKEREVINKEMERYKVGVQELTRIANPLGKMLYYLQEDVDVMQRELEMWRKETKYYGQQLKAEESKTDPEIERLKVLLTETQDSIADQKSRILSVKANIVQNEERIRKIIAAAKL